ncbi:MAG: UDP-N-acetylglucosamine 2-epimerase (non-hydrolyzing) [Cyclobacteriaceae bacterium]|nr:UDP-N-acetylglucosamine 2-epimerase (non-hydrolyzing) [Cyclobacteriaceae bacterium]
MKPKILFLLGTRPEAIKLAPVIKIFKDDSSFIVKCCSSGQHREMLNQALDFFNIDIDFDLKVMKHNQSLGLLTSNIIKRFDAVLSNFAPDLVFIHGDTTTSFCGALTCFYKKIPIAHIEAGLRTNNRFSPFPEEMNRVFNGYLSTIHFAPTKQAVLNLAEAKVSENVILTGNTVVDSLQFGLSRLKELNYEPVWKSIVDPNKRMILVTQHRRENFGDGIDSILNAILTLSEREDVQILFPVHLNPNIRDKAYQLLSERQNIHLLPPMIYPDMLWSMEKCYFIITDSGGIQEEAPTLAKPFLITRGTTERPEAIDSGAGYLVGNDFHKIMTFSMRLLDDEKFYSSCINIKNPYGDGLASERIHKFIREYIQR